MQWFDRLLLGPAPRPTLLLGIVTRPLGGWILRDALSRSALVAAVPAPRLVWVMVPAGGVTRAVLLELRREFGVGVITALARLGGRELPRQMHVEAIVWAALAMREGGGYLPPEHWHCWQNRQWKRLALKLGAPGEALLAVDPFDRIKCFHGGGAAKWWVPGRVSSGRMPPASPVLQHLPPAPFEPLTRQAYLKTRRWKDLAARLGYYRLMA